MRGDLNREGYSDAGREGARNAGQFVSSLLVVGDIRDTAAAVAKLHASGWQDGWGDLAWSAAGIVPVAGDALKLGRGAARTASALDNAADLVCAGEGFRGLRSTCATCAT